MGFFDTAREKIREHFEKNRENREKMQELHREADMQRQQIFEEQFKKNALEVAKSRAYKDAAEKSGIQKLRAETRIRRLNEQSSTPEPGSWRERLREYTSKNMLRREENLKRTEEIRAEADKMRKERGGQMALERNQRIPQSRNPSSTIGFSKPTWKM